jgi:hypothetical protein
MMPPPLAMGAWKTDLNLYSSHTNIRDRARMARGWRGTQRCLATPSTFTSRCVSVSCTH